MGPVALFKGLGNPEIKPEDMLPAPPWEGPPIPRSILLALRQLKFQGERDFASKVAGKYGEECTGIYHEEVKRILTYLSKVDPDRVIPRLFLIVRDILGGVERGA